MEDNAIRPASTMGWIGFLLGAGAFVLALVLFWAGPFAPQQSGGVSLGELAADIAKSAARSAVGAEQPAPQPVPRDIDDLLAIGVALLGGIGVVLGAIGLIRHESPRPAIGAIALAGSAIAFQWITGIVFALIGALIIMALLGSLSSVFDGIFGG